MKLKFDQHGSWYTYNSKEMARITYTTLFFRHLPVPRNDLVTWCKHTYMTSLTVFIVALAWSFAVRNGVQSDRVLWKIYLDGRRLNDDDGNWTDDGSVPDVYYIYICVCVCTLTDMGDDAPGRLPEKRCTREGGIRRRWWCPSTSPPNSISNAR